MRLSRMMASLVAGSPPAAKTIGDIGQPSSCRQARRQKGLRRLPGRRRRSSAAPSAAPHQKASAAITATNSPTSGAAPQRYRQKRRSGSGDQGCGKSGEKTYAGTDIAERRADLPAVHRSAFRDRVEEGSR